MSYAGLSGSFVAMASALERRRAAFNRQVFGEALVCLVGISIGERCSTRCHRLNAVFVCCGPERRRWL